MGRRSPRLGVCEEGFVRSTARNASSRSPYRGVLLAQGTREPGFIQLSCRDVQTLQSAAKKGTIQCHFQLYFSFLSQLRCGQKKKINTISKTTTTGEQLLRTQSFNSCCHAFDSAADLLQWQRHMTYSSQKLHAPVQHFECFVAGVRNLRQISLLPTCQSIYRDPTYCGNPYKLASSKQTVFKKKKFFLARQIYECHHIGAGKGQWVGCISTLSCEQRKINLGKRVTRKMKPA